jgi:hypothetical protein
MKELEPGKVENLRDGWISLRDMNPVDFWIGSQYRGNYNQQLQLDYSAVTAFCRDNDFPPIILRSDKWDPPAVHTPESVGPGLSALKKAAFSKHPNTTEIDKEDYRISTTDIKFEGKTFSMTPIGWDIHIKDRKIVYDYLYKHPSATKAQVEQAFITEMDTVLRNAFKEIALNEILAVRTLDKSQQYLHVSMNAMFQLVVLFAPGNFSSSRSLEVLLGKLANTVIWQDIYKLMNTGAFYATQLALSDKKNTQLEYYPKGDHRRASYWWRKKNFPDREESEYFNLNLPKTLATVAIPGGLFFEQLYKTLISLYNIKTPFFRLDK